MQKKIETSDKTRGILHNILPELYLFSHLRPFKNVKESYELIEHIDTPQKQIVNANQEVRNYCIQHI